MLLISLTAVGAGASVASAETTTATEIATADDALLQVDDDDGNELPDGDTDDETDTDGEPIGLDEATEGDDAGTDEPEAGANGTDIETDTDADAEEDADVAAGGEEDEEEEPPEDVTADEYYDDEQLDEWQAEIDTELSLDADVREMEAQSAFELFVQDEDEGEGPAGAEGTAQVGGGVGPSLDPGENAEELAEWLDEWLTSGFVWFIDEVVNNLLGTPYPENDGWMGILGTPVDEQYGELYDFSMEMVMLPVLSLVVIAFIFYTLFVVPTTPLLGRRVTPALLAVFGAVILVIFGWNFATLNQFAADAATQWFLPSDEELLEIEEDDEGADFSDDNHELRSGPTAALLGIKIFGWNIGAALLAFHSARHMILILIPALMPILLAGMFYGPRASKAVFSVAFWQYMALTYSNIPTVLFLSMAFHIDFAFGFAGEYGELSNVAMTMFLFALGIFFPVLFHSAAFGGALATIIMKGSVASAAGGYLRKRLPSSGAVKQRVTRGGGRLNPVSWYKRRSSTAVERDAKRRDVAARYGGGRSSARAGGYYTPRRQTGATGRTATDGGYPTTRSSRTSRSPPRRRSRDQRRGRDRSDSADAGSVDHRRRERYRRMRREDER